MKERAIIYLFGIIMGIMVISVLLSFTGINVEPKGLDCDFYCSECGNHIVIKQPYIQEPNEASYKAWFGWE